MSKRSIPGVIRGEELEELLESRRDVRLVDVRTPGEYESAHIRGAYNVPLDRLDAYATEIRSNVTGPVVLVCQSGARARRAEAALQECEMTNLHILEGGMNGWVSSGRAVERGSERLSLERQVRIVAGAFAAIGGILALAVSPLWALLPAFIGSGLVFAGVTDTCGMAMVLSKLPYNRSVSCDVEAMVGALKRGAAPAGIGRVSAAEAPAARSCAS